MTTFNGCHNCGRPYGHQNRCCTCTVEEQEAGYWNYLRNTPAEQERMGMYSMPDGYILRGVYENTTREKLHTLIKEQAPEFWAKHKGT